MIQELATLGIGLALGGIIGFLAGIEFGLKIGMGKR